MTLNTLWEILQGLYLRTGDTTDPTTLVISYYDSDRSMHVTMNFPLSETGIEVIVTPVGSRLVLKAGD